MLDKSSDVTKAKQEDTKVVAAKKVKPKAKPKASTKEVVSARKITFKVKTY